MNLAIYKPNGKNAGFAFNFQIGEDGKSKEPVLFVSSIAQHSWDSKKRIGSFSPNRKNPEKTISIKFNQFECGEILSCLKNRYAYETFHSFDSNKTVIKFSPWDKEVKSTRLENNQPKESSHIVPAFGLVITRNGNQVFRLPLTPGECECLISLLNLLMRKIFLARERKVEMSKSQNRDELSSGTSSNAPPF